MNSRFRVWDGEEMHLPPHDYVLAGDGDLLLCLPEIEKFGQHYDGDDVTLGVADDSHEVMHHTGLDDAEGTPVYQSDLMKMVNVEGVFEVIWSTRNARWEIVAPGGDHGFPLGAHNHSHIVAGNKFETPELIDD